MDLRTNSLTSVLYIFNRLVFIAEVKSVYSAVRTKSLYITDTFRPLRVNVAVTMQATAWNLVEMYQT